MIGSALEIADHVGGALLAMDASSREASVALVDPARRAVEELYPDATALPSESLAACVARVVHEGAVDELKGVVVGLGPGSFTGLRVALALVKGMAFGAGLPVYGVSSLALLAARRPGRLVELGVDAQRQEIYSALYRVDSLGVPEPLIADCATTRESWTATLRRFGMSGEERLGDIDGFISETPRALAGVLIAAARIRDRASDPVEDLVPCYLKVSEAERNLT